MSKSSKKKSELVAGEESSGTRHDQVAEIAYYLAEKRGFESGNELDDWFAAEGSLAEKA
jgi:Protein of unknown function (DUF2934)